MMILSDIYFFLKNLTYPTKSGMSSKKRIIFDYLRISFKALFFRLFGLSQVKEKIFGYTVEAFNYETIRFLYGEIFLRGEYTFKSQNDAPIILDCGANIGMAVIFFKWLYPNSKIYAFEPDPKTFVLLEKNINANNFKDVYLDNSAIMDKEGTTVFFNKADSPGSLTMSVNSSRSNGDSISVRTISLNSFLRRSGFDAVDFAKIDIEGSEDVLIKDVFVGGSMSIVKAFAIEYHHKIGNDKSKLGRFLGLLEQAGFEYQIDAHMTPLSAQEKFQDIIIRGYRGNINV